MESLRCHGSSDVNKTLIRSNFHLYIVQLWFLFFDIFVNADVVNAQSGRGAILPKKSSRVEQIKKSLDLQISSLVGYFKKINALNTFMKLFVINGVYIKGFYKL